MRKTAVLGAIALGAVAALIARKRPGSATGGEDAGELPSMSLADTIAFVMDVPLPNLVKGVIKRRKSMVGVAEAAQLDKRAVLRMQRLHERYGAGPVLLRIPFRTQAVILDPGHVTRVLDETPDPFATASNEKKAALRHFEPHGALISHGPARTERRRFNEAVLQSDCPVHSMARQFEPVVRHEARELLTLADRSGGFGWEEFAEAWFRVVRRVVLGDRARDDVSFHEAFSELRFDANWAFLKPRNDELRKRVLEELRQYLRDAEEGSLVQAIAQTPKNELTQEEHQVPQWLFAFDPAGMATNRALALLAAHPAHFERARAEAQAARLSGDMRFPLLRATILEALRLWPTTPLILRQTTRSTTWNGRVLPARSGVAIFAPFFHRDDRRLPFAHRFAPEIWSEDPPAEGWPLVPFSGGPAICPARHLVPLLGSIFLAEIIDGRSIELSEPQRLDPVSLPATFDHYTMRYTVRPVDL